MISQLLKNVSILFKAQSTLQWKAKLAEAIVNVPAKRF